MFLESLDHLPRDLWRPTLVIIDEAHIYCAERGSGEAESHSHSPRACIAQQLMLVNARWSPAA
jgi:hypothetical protein